MRLLKHLLIVSSLVFLANISDNNRMQGELDEVYVATWSPDGTRIASGHANGVIAFTDATTSDVIATFQLDNPDAPGSPLSAVEAIAWSFDNRFIAAGTTPSGFSLGLLFVIDAETGEIVFFTDNQRGIPSIAWHPSTYVLATAAPSISQIEAPDAVLIWDITAEEQLAAINVSELQGVYSVAWSPDGERIATGGQITNNVLVFDSQSGELQLTLQGHTGQTRTVEWSTDGTYLASGGADNTVKIWASNSGEQIEEFETKETVESIDWNPLENVLAIADQETVTIFDIDTAEVSETFEGQTLVEWSPFGGRLVYATLDAGQRTLADTGLSIAVPDPSVEQLQAISEVCDPDGQTTRSQTLTPTTEVLSDFIAQVEAEDSIEPVCAADLTAVAEALIAEQ